jgi:DNA-binding transcriptional ArsR family regulator
MNIVHKDMTDDVPLRFLIGETIKASSIAVHYADGRVGQLSGLKLTRVKQAGEAEPARAAKAAQPARKRVLPAESDHGSYLVGALRSGLGQYIGLDAFAVWLYLLSLAPIHSQRLVAGVSHGAIGKALGASTRWRVARAIRRLKEAGLIVERRPGRTTRGAVRLTAEYQVPRPTAVRVESWHRKLAGEPGTSAPASTLGNTHTSGGCAALRPHR